jgi:hypothetical protein
MDLRFGRSMSVLRISDPQRRDCLLLLNGFAILLLTLLGAAAESLGIRSLRTSTVNRCVHSRYVCVLIVNQKPRRRSIPSAALHYLLGYLLCRRKGRCRNVQEFPVHVPDYKEDVERLKQNCLDAEEIARPYARFMALVQVLCPMNRGGVGARSLNVNSKRR